MPALTYRKTEYVADGSPAFTRYVLINHRLLRISVNQIHPGIARDVLHNHASTFLSVILRGGYTENVWLGIRRRHDRRWYRNIRRQPSREILRRAGSFRLVSKHDVHQIVAPALGTWTVMLSVGPASGVTGFGPDAADDPEDACLR